MSVALKAWLRAKLALTTGRPETVVLSGGERTRRRSPQFRIDALSRIAGTSSNTKGPPKLFQYAARTTSTSATSVNALVPCVAALSRRPSAETEALEDSRAIADQNRRQPRSRRASKLNVHQRPGGFPFLTCRNEAPLCIQTLAV